MKPPHRDESPPPPRRGGEEERAAPAEKSSGNWEDRQRGRSIPNSCKILVGAWSFLVLWLSLPLLIVSLVMRIRGFHDPWTVLCLVSLCLLVISLVVALGISLTVKCPLCHGVPLHSRHGCHKHRLADRWFPLTCRATVVLRILTTLSFRCMYCGTPFRLFKKSSRQRQ